MNPLKIDSLPHHWQVLAVTLKALVTAGLMAFSSVWFAVGAGLVVASVVASPLLFRAVRDAVFADPERP